MTENSINNKALLVIDIQKDFTGEQAKMPVDKNQAVEMISNINFLIENREKFGLTIVYIGNEYSKTNILNIFRNFAAIKGTEGTQPDSKLKIVSKNYFPKNKGNAFSNAALDKFLKQNNIQELFLSGLYAEACIYQTMKGALKNNFQVKILSDCIATKTDEKRNKMIEKYKKSGVQILKSKEIMDI